MLTGLTGSQNNAAALARFAPEAVLFAHDSEGIPALHWAAINDAVDVVLATLALARERGYEAAVVNRIAGEARGTAAHWAARQGACRALHLLVTSPLWDPSVTDWQKHTVLHAAVCFDQPAATLLLLAHGCDVGACDALEGRSALGWACALSTVTVPTVKFLLLYASRDDLDAIDAHGRTPLHWAVFQGKWDIAMELVRTGARADVDDATGKQPLHLVLPESRHKADWLRELLTLPPAVFQARLRRQVRPTRRTDDRPLTRTK